VAGGTDRRQCAHIHDEAGEHVDFDALMHQPLAWVEAFTRRHGRAPRILHLGNIANNAYNNAKILAAAGFECDVLCNDYYHVMGTPEWEDADFQDGPGDQFRPVWHRLDLGGFERPRWFAQGRLRDCLDYLLARRDGRVEQADRLWRRLQATNGTAPPGPAAGVVLWAERRWLDFKDWILRQRRPRSRSTTSQVSTAAASSVRSASPAARVSKGILHDARAVVVEALLSAYTSTKVVGRRMVLCVAASSARGVDVRLARTFAEAFPDRADRLTPGEVLYPAAYLRRWRDLLGRYDVVQAYGTHVIFPLLAEFPFVAFEHGTLREIPFEDSSIGRLTALGYNQARAVLVTNSDCLDNARALASGAVRFINHPYDEDHGMGVQGVAALRFDLASDLDADFLVFFPTRQDWVPGAGFADKANDVLLRAFARLRQGGLRIGMVCCTWGRNVEASRRLLDTLGVSAHVRWTDPMGMVRFDRHVAACDVVADQFKIGAFGGVLFKAMAVGTPVCTYLDDAVMRERYREPPPVLNSRTEDDVVRALAGLAADPAGGHSLGAQARTWIKRYHAAAEVVARQSEIYAALCGWSHRIVVTGEQ
jgi:glycosyltransferase involved in cell wall biosynthesis